MLREPPRSSEAGGRHREGHGDNLRMTTSPFAHTLGLCGSACSVCRGARLADEVCVPLGSVHLSGSLELSEHAESLCLYESGSSTLAGQFRHPPPASL